MLLRSFTHAAVLGVVLSFCATAAAEVPPMLSYQGLLTDAVGNPVTGDWTVTFAIFPKLSGGEAMFEETLEVSTNKGLFSAYLGAAEGNPLDPALLQGGDAWLELTFETDVGPIVLKPRQQIVSTAFAFFADGALTCEEAANAATLGGKQSDAYVTLQQVPDLCVQAEDLPALLAGLGYLPGGGYSDADVAAYLAANGFNACTCYGDVQVEAYLVKMGYLPGPGFSGKYDDLIGKPDLSQFLTDMTVVDVLAASGAVLMADGSVALTGNLEFAQYEARNLVVHRGQLAPKSPATGQLWWSTGEKILKIYDGTQWAGVGGGGMAADLSCNSCVDSSDVSFNFAASATKNGAAADVDCNGCVGSGEVSFAWAKGTIPGGDAEHSLTSDTATNSLTSDLAGNVTCPGCVDLADINPAAMDGKYVAYSNKTSGLQATNVQAAIDAVAKAGGTGFTEGNGTIVPYTQQWGLPAYGNAVNHVHLMNPAQPKVVAHLYATQSASFATSNNLVVAYNFTPNSYSAVATGTAGQSSIEVSNPGIFNYGNHILVHQPVGTGGNGTNSGKWETNQVVGVQGNQLLLAKPLQNSYKTNACDQGQAQVVVAASYNLLEVVGGGTVYPKEQFGGGETQGGVVYIRARKIVVKSGGKIHADSYGFEGGNHDNCDSSPYRCERGHSECNICEDAANLGTNANCSGGGGGNHSCWNPSLGGGGGGGNKEAGKAGIGGQAGSGGTAKGDGTGTYLHFGGGGGRNRAASGGYGGGIVVLGAETIIVEPGGVISANGADGGGSSSGSYGGGGAGAGGTVALFADEVVNSGTIEAKGGKGGQATATGMHGGDGGAGWVVQKPPLAGLVNESYPKGIEIWLDGKEVTPTVGDPNSKGAPSWDDAKKKWGKDGLNAWETGPLDLTTATDWTLGTHEVEVKETGGAGGELKFYLYVIYPFSKSSPPANDTCSAPQFLDLAGPVVVSGTTEDVMGKIKATDANQAPFCGGSLGPDVVYAFTLADWRQLTVNVTAPFTPRTYIKKKDCLTGSVVGCGEASWTSSVLEPGTYYFFVDGDGNLQKGDFKLSVSPAPPGPPANDLCAGAKSLTFEGGTAKTNDMSLFATDNYSAVCGGGGANDLVYKFTVAPGTSELAVTVQGDFNPVIYLAKDNCAAAPIVCIPQSTYTMGWPTPGTYYLFVDGKTVADKGIFTLTVTVK